MIPEKMTYPMNVFTIDPFPTTNHKEKHSA
jgi:hypothetical protein